MKNIFSWMLVGVVLATLTTSCKKDDEFDPEQLVSLMTSNYWEGMNTEQRKEFGSFVDKGSKSYVVMRFDRAGKSMSGQGRQLEFDGPYYNTLETQSNFSWKLEGEIVTIFYQQPGWTTVTFNLREAQLTNNTFRGFMFVQDDHRYVYDYVKSSFSNWDKY